MADKPGVYLYVYMVNKYNEIKINHVIALKDPKIQNGGQNGRHGI